jgi:hypothetical protein
MIGPFGIVKKGRDGFMSFRLVVIAAVLALQLGCQNKQETAKPKQAVTTVNRVSPVCSLEVPCDTNERMWSGPDKSVVHLTVTSALECPASVIFIDTKTLEETPAGLQAPAAKSNAGTVTVPATSLLGCDCGGEGKNSCTCKINGVDPPLPPNVVMGQPQAITPGPPVTDPAAPPAAGTPVKVSCGKEAALWQGPESYVTVTYKAPDNKCIASVSGGGHKDTTDERPFTHTFGPVKSLTAICEGKGTAACDFQVTETIALP